MPIPVNLTPPPARPRGLLLDAAERIPGEAYDADRGASRWPLEGVTFNPFLFDQPTGEEAACDTVYDKLPDSIPELVTQPAFLIWRSLQCSRLSGMKAWLQSQANYAVETLESAAFAPELETGAASGGNSLVDAAVVLDATPYTFSVETMVILEQFLDDQLNGAVGFIHLTPALLAAAVALRLAHWDDGVYRTSTGHVVVGDAGHSGAFDAGTGAAAGTGEAWVYATSTIWWDDTPTVDGGSFGVDAGDFDFGRNVDRPLSERHGILVFDPNIVGAVHVDTTDISYSTGESAS